MADGFNPNAEQIEVAQYLSSNGASLETVAKALGISRRALQRAREKHLDLGDAIELGKGLLATEIVGHLLAKIRRGDTASTIFGCKVLAGLREHGPALQEQKVAVQITLPAALPEHQFRQLGAAVVETRTVGGGD